MTVRPERALLLDTCAFAFAFAFALLASVACRPAQKSLPPRVQAAPGAAVSVRVELAAPGVSISPLIYGVSLGDQALLARAGVTTRRVGGNENSPYDWQTGFTSLGHDWFFQNRKQPDTPHPEQNRWALAFRADQQFGLASYLTLPSMGWVAKDDTSFGFPRSIYPDQLEFARDRTDAGTGFVPGADGKAREIVLAPGTSHNGKRVSPEQQTELLKYSVEQSGFGRAADGGIQFVCLDNEPMLWDASHRDLITTHLGYQDYWNHMLPYAERLKAIDPGVLLAAPALWGWTAYFYSAKDAHWVKTQNHGFWDRERLPEYALKHGKTPFLAWWLGKVGEYRRQHGKALFDIVDIHTYPQMAMLARPREQQQNVPEVMEFRLESLRSLWDPDYRTTETWMGDETGGKLAILRLVKTWIAEHAPGMKLAIGEYDWSGPDGGFDVSGAIAQIAILHVFARERVDMAYYWATPRPKSPVLLAFELLRNPDGQHTAIGDELVAASSSHPRDVEAFVTRRSADRSRLSLVLLNLRARQSARVRVELGAKLAVQTARCFELAQRDSLGIRELPPRSLSGSAIDVELAPMSAQRCDVRL
jgi:hypothetical protein